MGLDYTVNFGIGYKIKKVSHEILEDFYEDFYTYLRIKLKDFPNGAEYFEVGRGYYGGEPNEWFLTVANPFENGLDLTHIKDYLDDIIDSIGLEKESEFGLVGGGLMC